MAEFQHRFVLVPPALLRSAYALAGFSCVIVAALNLKMWPPVVPSILFSIVVLVVGWWKVLFWNPVMEVIVESGSATLVRRRGPAAKLTRTSLETMSEYVFGGFVKNTGIRFTMRDGNVFETWAVSDGTRLLVTERMASELDLKVLDQSAGPRMWSA